MKTKVYFIGMSKNCFESLKLNLEFLINFKEISNIQLEICIIDSDSTDGTKEYCRKLINDKLINEFFEIDNLEDIYDSRVERLSICRNEGLEYLSSQLNNGELIYIPMDMDISLFEYIDFEMLENFIISVKNNIDGLFPYSSPYYYDIFALRAENWVTENNVYLADLKKQKYNIFSFFFNYKYIFKFQKRINYFKIPLIQVESAFGGMGIYKISSELLKKLNYKVEINNKDSISEHVYFNKFFKKLYISQNWIIPAPKNYIFYKSASKFQKIIYILKTIKTDLSNL